VPTEITIKNVAVELSSNEAKIRHKAKMDKTRRTLYLNDQNFKSLQIYCSQNNLVLSELVDTFILKFLEREKK